MLLSAVEGDSAPAPAAFFSPWGLLTNPYCLSAVVCAVLAIAVSHYLQHDLEPTRDAKPRVVHSHVRRLDEFLFVFKGGHAAPYTLVDTNAATVHSLFLTTDNHRSEPSDSDSSATDDDDLGRFTLDGSVYIAKRIAPMADVRVLESGLYFQKGRAVRVSFSGREKTFLFHSKIAAEAFLNVLHHGAALQRHETVSVFLTTFNVGNAHPPDDLSPWLAQAADADIIAVGAQECSYTPSAAPADSSGADLQFSANIQDDGSSSRDGSEEANDSSPLLEAESSNGESLATLSSTSRHASSQSSGRSSFREHWHALLVSHFPEENYACITKQVAWDRCLTIFVKQSLLPAVSHVRSDTANVGLGRVAGNKGAIGTRFSVFDTDFIIINSHLAAHHKEVNRRNEDFASIAQGLRNLRDDPEVDILSSAVHHVFWMGDLNYRINLERDEVMKLVTERNWKALQASDQLNQEREKGNAFQHFLEGETNFPPTYRYEHGSRKYSDVKLRIPSWCDRILYRSLPGCNVQLYEYKPADEIMTSDHSPVSALLSASLTHTTVARKVDHIVPRVEHSIEETSSPSLISSPRSLSVRSLLQPREAQSFLQLVFTKLKATDIPEMDHGGRRIAVAKALRIDSHMGWKKHDELGAGQHADPYCTFHGYAVAELDEGEYRSSTVTASQNPVWAAENIPAVDLMDTDRGILRRRHIMITVKDENPARRDGIIGCAVLWLGEAEKKEAVKFSISIMSGGLKRGELAGEYSIR